MKFQKIIIFFLIILFGICFLTAAESQSNNEEYLKLVKAIKESERNMPLTEKMWKEFQRQKQDVMLNTYLKKYNITNELVLKAFTEVPREYFVYNYETKTHLLHRAYSPEPTSIGYGSALSDYSGQAIMTQLADPKPGEVALEIGTGSGFQASILARICKKVATIEIIKPLGEQVAKIFKPIGYTNVYSKVGDGYYGWEEHGPYDIIMVTCLAPYIPPPLINQLKVGGRMVIPIGHPWKAQTLYLVTKSQDGKIKTKAIRPILFMQMKGAVQKIKPPVNQ